MSKVLLLPGWMTALKFYGDNNGLDIQIGKLKENYTQADCVIGISLSALVVLRDINRINGKVILINPPLPKRNILIWFARWVRFITADGLFFERQKFTKNPIKLILTLVDCLKLLKTDFSAVLKNLPKERITVIRGKGDKYFCDDKAADFIRSIGIELIEVDSGHNWSELVEKSLKNT